MWMLHVRPLSPAERVKVGCRRSRAALRSGAVMTLAVGPEIGSGLRVI